MRKCSGVPFILTLAVVLFLLSPSPSPTPPPTTAPNGPIADLLPALPGLSDLYPPAPNSTAQLSWGLLRPLLCRSDALPGTAAGVLEAAEAWRNLTLSVAAAAASEEEGRPQGTRCLSSVGGDLRAGRARLPCGLVEGAAVTVVGVPREGAAKFWVEMLGASGEVVLHVNVSLGAAGMVVEQNSWTPEEGWGEWERCPPVGDVGSSNSSLQRSPVDGLVHCNEKVGERIVQENNNTVVNLTGNQPEDWQSPRGHGQLSGSFSIVEGEPFTVILWAGVEGFHMTVNGRHETSFAYREELGTCKKARRSEPWLVAEVKVSGDLELLSFLANGLPVSEDIDMASVAVLKAPPLPKKRTFLLVGVFSTGNNFKRRMALRRTWMQYEAVRSGDVAVRFFTGLHKNEHVNMELWREAQLYGDIQLMPFVDMYPPWAHGPGYIISRDIAKFVVRGHQELTLQLFKLEDVAMGIWIQQYKNSGQQVNIVTDDRFYNEGCDADYVLAHYQTPRLMMCLWEKLKTEYQAICCE